MVQTPNGVILPIIIKNGLPYLEHHYPTDKQMREISREEFMTLKNDWDPSKYDDTSDEVEVRLRQIPSTPIEATASFYDTEGNIRAHKVIPTRIRL